MPFDSHDMKPMYSVLLCMLFGLVRFDTHDMLYIFSFAEEFGHPDASFDTLDMKCILIHCTVLYIQITILTLSTWNQCILCVNCCILPLIFRHSRHSFALNFLNNGPIFIPIEPLELSQCPLAFDGIYYHVYMIYTFMSRVSKRLFECTVQYNVLICISCRECRNVHRMLEETETIPMVQSEWKSDHY